MPCWQSSVRELHPGGVVEGRGGHRRDLAESLTDLLDAGELEGGVVRDSRRGVRQLDDERVLPEEVAVFHLLLDQGLDEGQVGGNDWDEHVVGLHYILLVGVLIIRVVDHAKKRDALRQSSLFRW